MNEMICKKRLVSARLAFGIITRFSTISSGLPARIARTEAIKTAQAEMGSIVAKSQIQNALSHDISLPVDKFYDAKKWS